MKKTVAILTLMAVLLGGLPVAGGRSHPSFVSVSLAEDAPAEVEFLTVEEPLAVDEDGEGGEEELDVEGPDEIYAGDDDADLFVVGSTTKMRGEFFTNMWGNNGSDMDVRTLLHSYSPVTWTMQSLFEVNDNVVQEIMVGYLDNGNKMYTITIHNDLVYNDGTPITSEDYVFSLLLHASPQIAQIGGDITSVMHIAGYEAYASGESEMLSGLGLSGPYTFTIEIDKDYLPYFYESGMIDAVPYPISAIAPGCAVFDEGEGAYIANADESEEEPLFTAELLQQTILDPATGYMSNPRVTSGPYELIEYNAKEASATFRRNPYFKGDHTGQRPMIPRIKFVCVSQETMIDQLASGEVDLLNKCVAGDYITQGLTLASAGEIQSATYSRMGLGFLAFACERNSPVQFEAVRQAVAYSFDSAEYLEALGIENYGMSTYGFYGLAQWMVQMIMNPTLRPETTTTEEAAHWDSLTLDTLNPYAKDLDKAKEVLEADGWVLNKDGDPFTEGEDEVRYKDVDGELMELRVLYGKTENNAAAQVLEDLCVEPLASIGFILEIEELDFADVLRQYYRLEERAYDALFLGSNFTRVFDPYFAFSTEEGATSQNTTGYQDEVLEELALDLRSTQPGAMLEYCQKWMNFQLRFNEKLPLLPLYSNVYFDFFSTDLSDYAPNSQMSWSTAILYAYTGDEKPYMGESQTLDLEDGASAQPMATIDDTPASGDTAEAAVAPAEMVTID